MSNIHRNIATSLLATFKKCYEKIIGNSKKCCRRYLQQLILFYNNIEVYNIRLNGSIALRQFFLKVAEGYFCCNLDHFLGLAFIIRQDVSFRPVKVE